MMAQIQFEKSLFRRLNSLVQDFYQNSSRWPELLPLVLLLFKRFADLGGLSASKPLSIKFQLYSEENPDAWVLEIHRIAKQLDDQYPSRFSWQELVSEELDVYDGRDKELLHSQFLKALSELNLKPEKDGSDMFVAAFEYLVVGLPGQGEIWHDDAPLSDFVSELLDLQNSGSVYSPNIGTGAGLGNLVYRLHYNSEDRAWPSIHAFGHENRKSVWKAVNLLFFSRNTGLRENWDWQFDNSDCFASPMLDGSKLKQFDRVFSIVPFGQRLSHFDFDEDRFGRFPYGKPPKQHSEWAYIQHCLSSTSDEGRCVVITYLGPLVRKNLENLRSLLIQDDVLEAVIKLPFEFVPGVKASCYALLFNKQKAKGKTGKVIMVDAQRQDLTWSPTKNSSTNVGRLISNFVDEPHVSKVVPIEQILANEAGLDVALYTDDSELAHSLRELKKSYPNYGSASFSDEEVVFEILRLKKAQDISIGGNFIYLPNIANMEPVVDLKTHLEGRKTKLDRYWRLSLNPDKVRADYLQHFFKSDLGKALYRSLGKGVTVPHISLADLKKCQIVFPDLLTQDLILDVVEKLDRLASLSDKFKDEVSLNPDSAASLVGKLDDMLSAVSQLSEEDEVVSILRAGETKTSEFKETFEYNEHTDNKRDARLVDTCIKTVAAFLNSDGGELLVGVADDGQIVGLERDLKLNQSSADRFLLKFKDFVSRRIGPQFYPLINQRIVSIKGKQILRVTCLPSDQMAFVDEKEVYVRTNPATDKLEGKALMDYSRRRFPSQ